jgi:GNAT superfamily N-acetyltransferase
MPPIIRRAVGISGSTPFDFVTMGLGEQTSLRPLSTPDAPAIHRLLRGLDMPSRCARFAGACSDEAMARHACFVLLQSSFAVGAMVGGDLRGVLEIHECPTRPGLADVSLVVERDWRRQGLASSMLSAAIAWAGCNNIDTLQLTFSRGNWAMRRLAASAHARLDITLDEISAEIDIVPDVLSCPRLTGPCTRWPERALKAVRAETRLPREDVLE